MIRPARPLDAGATAAILSDFIDETDWMPRIHTRAEDLAHVAGMIDRGWVSVAAPGAVAGFIARDADMVHALYVARPARAAGLGKALLDHAKSGRDRLTLWTFQANLGAQAFYLREGFQEVTRTAGEDNDEGLPDIRYDWHRSTS